MKCCCLRTEMLLCVVVFIAIWSVFPLTRTLNVIKCNDILSRVLETGTKTQTDTNITIVTEFFHIGSFQKGINYTFTPTMYYKWAEIYGYLHNYVIIYTDSESFMGHMKSIRKELLDRTKIILIERSSSWAFQSNDKINTIYKQEEYPKHYPNTVVSEYACTQHAKYDVISRAAKDNVFGTKYFMWLDIGYFRDMTDLRRPFYLSKPRKFNESKIAMNRIHYDHQLFFEPKSIFHQNLVYVGGGLVFGERKQILKFSSDYKRAVDYFISQGLMNSDQQVIYAMFSDEGRKVLKPEVELQCYASPKDDNWFYLGYTMVVFV